MVKFEDERAFPVTMTDGPESTITNLGMTLRDYFAAKAMQGFLSGPMDRVEFEGDADVARISYIMADAMLAERDK